jgi:hypothetical protein
LGDGLRQIIAGKKQALIAEPGKWIVQTHSTPKAICRCPGNCRNCPCQPHADKGSKSKRIIPPKIRGRRLNLLHQGADQAYLS